MEKILSSTDGQSNDIRSRGSATSIDFIFYSDNGLWSDRMGAQFPYLVIQSVLKGFLGKIHMKNYTHLASVPATSNIHNC